VDRFRCKPLWGLSLSGGQTGHLLNRPTVQCQSGRPFPPPPLSGQGIGRRLFAKAIHDLAQRGYREVTLWVLDTNQRARSFYESAGWVPDGATKTEELPGAVLREVRYRAELHPDDDESPQ